MRFVFDMWNEDVFNLFMENGANLNDNVPLAWALVHKMRPALGVLKRHVDNDPNLIHQANLALRHHAYKGSAKWVSLLLWAGADPLARGSDDVEDVEDDTDGGLNAAEYAVLADNLDILAVKGFLPSPEAQSLLRCARTPKTLSFLLEKGHTPSQLPDRGTEAINSNLSSMTMAVESSKRHNYDSDRAREYLRMVHMLVANDAKWLPADKATISSMRRALVRMIPGYTLEFIWLMQRYRAARRSDVQELIRSPAMVRLLAPESETAAQLLAQVPTEVQ